MMTVRSTEVVMSAPKTPHTRMKRIEVSSMNEVHEVIREAFKHGTHMAYDSYRFCRPVTKRDHIMIARVAAILPNAYVLVTSNGESVKYEV